MTGVWHLVREGFFPSYLQLEDKSIYCLAHLSQKYTLVPHKSAPIDSLLLWSWLLSDVGWSWPPGFRLEVQFPSMGLCWLGQARGLCHCHNVISIKVTVTYIQIWGTWASPAFLLVGSFHTAWQGPLSQLPAVDTPSWKPQSRGYMLNLAVNTSSSARHINLQTPPPPKHGGICLEFQCSEGGGEKIDSSRLA